VPRELRGLIRWFRERVEALGAQGTPWQAVVDGLRPHVPRLWKQLSAKDRVRFVRRIRPYWDAARHRAPVEGVELASTWKRQGRLQVLAGRLASCAAGPGALAVRVRVRGGGERKDRFDALIRCIGPALEESELRAPLVQSLMQNGLAVRDPAGLGIITGPEGEVVDPSGRPSDWLFGIGAVRRASAWETTAVPEIARDAMALAERLAPRDALRPARESPVPPGTAR
jgi:uncharacterized NAD(P)/FAD-binding protein YdhS